MEQFIMKGGNPLVGEVTIGGAKNAARQSSCWGSYHRGSKKRSLRNPDRSNHDR